MKVVAVTGLDAEARIARRAGWEAVAGAGDAARTRSLIDLALKDGAEALVSFGIAGGLAPGLPNGALILPKTVVEADGTSHSADETWHANLIGLLGPGIEEGAILGAASIAATSADKAELFSRTKAVAVDLESHLVARAASAAGIPWVIIRTVADPAVRDLPSAALIPLNPLGKPALPAVLRAVARKPGQIPALLTLARETKAALATLTLAIQKIATDARPRR